LGTYEEFRQTDRLVLERVFELPERRILAGLVEKRDLGQHLLEVHLGLLRALAKWLDAPPRGVAEELEDEVEELVAWDTSHALELALCRLGFGFLGDRESNCIFFESMEANVPPNWRRRRPRRRSRRW
jgi:hypothetical protein